MGKYKRLGKNTAYVAIGNIGSKVISFLMLPLYTRWMNPEEFGTSDVVTVYASLLMSFVSLCIADAIFVLPKRSTEEEKKSYYSSGVVYTIGALILSALLIIIAQKICISRRISNSFVDNFWLIYLMMATQYVQSFTQNFAQAIDKMLVYGLTGVVSTACMAGFAFIFIPGNGAFGYVLSVALAQICATVFTCVASKSYKYFSFGSVDKAKLKDLLKYGMPLIPNSIMWWLVNGMNRPLIIEYIGMDANGLLAVANKLPVVISMMFVIFSNAFTVSLLEEYGKEGFVAFFDNSLKIIMIPTILAASFLAMLSQPVIQLFTTPEYYVAYKYMPLCILGVLLQSISGFIGGVFAARKESKYFFYSSCWGAVASLVAMFILIPTIKLYGAVLSVVISFLIMVVVRYLYAQKDLKGIDLKYYTLLLVLYSCIAVVVILEMATLWKQVLYVAILTIMLLISRAYISRGIVLVKQIVKDKIRIK